MHIALAERLPAEHVARLTALGELAAAAGVPAYLVGGPVRDALLCRASLDVDVTVEGEAARLAEAAARHFGGELTSHERFGTCVVQMPGWHLDVATARRETYPEPGALPVVAAATLDEDLQRRDFSYNAMAMRLDRDFGLLLDPLGGLADLRAGVTRGLHERTFRDDPTRLLRAARYVARFGCPLEPRTQQWLDDAVAAGALGTVTGQRVWGELSRLLAEATAPEALGLLECWGVLEQLGLAGETPALRDGETPALRDGAVAVAPEGRVTLVAQQALGLTDWDRAMATLGLVAGGGRPAISARFGLSAAEAAAAGEAADAVAAPPQAAFAAGAKSSTLYESLAPLPAAALLALWVRRPAARLALERFRGLDARLDIDGHDLQAEGFAPSPGFRPALAAALRAKLDEGAGRDEQLAAARQALRAWQTEHEL